MKIIIAIIWFGLLVYEVAVAQMYIWVDENGVKNFSNAPPPSASAEGSQLDCQDEITSIEPSPEPEYNPEESFLEHQRQIQERYMNLLKQQIEFSRSMEFGNSEATDPSMPMGEDAREKAEQLARMVDKETDRLEAEYKETLSDCSDRHFPNARKVIDCRERTDQQYKERIELLENDSEAYFNRYGGRGYSPYSRGGSRPVYGKSRTAPLRHNITIPVKTSP